MKSDDFNTLIGKLTEARKIEVLKLIQQKLKDQGEELDFIVKNASCIEAIEVVSLAPGSWRQEHINKKIDVPAAEIPEDYDVAILVLGDSVPPFVYDGDLIFVKFPYGTYNASFDAVEIAGIVFVETQAKDGSIYYIRDYSGKYSNVKNSGVIVSVYRGEAAQIA